MKSAKSLTRSTNRSLDVGALGMLMMRFRGFIKAPVGQGKKTGINWNSPGSLERTVYDPDHKSEAEAWSPILNLREIIIPDGDEEPSPNLFCFLTSRTARVADVAVLVVTCGTTIISPLTFIWGGSLGNPSEVPGGVVLLAVDILLDVVYLAYLLLQLNTSFMHPIRRTEVVNRSSVREWWLSSPLYWFRCFSTTAYLWAAAGVSLLINNIKVVRALHFLWLPNSLWRLDDMSWVRMLRPLVLLVGGSHWVACLLFYFGGYREKLASAVEGEYETTFNGHEVSASFSLYLMAFVEGLYLLTGSLDNPLGDGGPRDKNAGSLLMVLVFGPVGCVVVALVISVIIREQAMEFALDVRHEENKAFMTRAMRILNIPDALQWRVLSMHYYQKLGHDHEACSELFNKRNLSPPLKNALLVYAYRDTIMTSRYFQGKDPNYIIEVLGVLQDLVFLPGDYVARKGEVATEMMFVMRGDLQVLVPEGQGNKGRASVSKTTKVKDLHKGDFFGEVALVQDTVHSAWVRAETYVLVAVLCRNDIQRIWHYYKDEKECLERMVRDTAAQDRERMKKQMARQRWKKVKCTDPTTLNDGVLEEEDDHCETRPAEAAAKDSGAAVAESSSSNSSSSSRVRTSGNRQRGPEVASSPAPPQAHAAALGVVEEIRWLQDRMKELLDRQSSLERTVGAALGHLHHGKKHKTPKADKTVTEDLAFERFTPASRPAVVIPEAASPASFAPAPRPAVLVPEGPAETFGLDGLDLDSRDG